MNDNLNKLQKILAKAFRKAKRWYVAYLACQFAVLIFAIISIFFEISPNLTAVIAFLGVLASECVRWRSDYWKSEGETAKRSLELADGLGAALESRDIADWLAAKPKGFLDDVAANEIMGSEFDSTQPVGPRRMLENTQESAWWSKHESRSMTFYLGGILIIVLVAAFVALAVSIGTLKAANVPQTGVLVQNVGGIICSALVFVFSVNLIRLLVEFWTFASRSEDILRRSGELLKLPAPSEREALSMLHAYQIARNSAPLLPTLVWKLRGGHLREQWASFRPKVQPPASL
jgi:uncharacterized metal-binding protein